MARGDGTTTRQMQDAAKGAYFVWVNGQLQYPRRLAAKIGRDDLNIVSSEFFGDMHRWRGIEFSDIVIDHAAYLTERAYENIEHARRLYIRRTRRAGA